jgi:hypothetical protein
VYPDSMVHVRVRLYLYRWHDRAQDDTGNTNYEVRFLSNAWLHRMPCCLVASHVISWYQRARDDTGNTNHEALPISDA